MNEVLSALLAYLRSVYPNYNVPSQPSDFRQIEARPSAYIGANLGKLRYPALFIEPDREGFDTGPRGIGATATYTVAINIIDSSVESNGLLLGTQTLKSVGELWTDVWEHLGKNKKLGGVVTGLQSGTLVTYANFAVDTARYGLAAVCRVTYEDRARNWSGPENNEE